MNQVILPPAPAVSNEGPSSRLLGPLPAVSRPWVSAWGSLEPPRRDGENAQKTRKNGGKLGEIQPEKCEGRELTKINWQIGVYGYYLANASENTISGGFISGGPNNMTVIRSVGKSSRNQTLVQFSSRHWFVVVAWPRR